MNPAIVYLAQNRGEHTELLSRSLELLHDNFNSAYQHQVLIFHEGDFSPHDQERLIGHRKNIQFVRVDFQIPDFLAQEEIPATWRLGKFTFSLGFRHMCRFYSIQLFDILHQMGHDWYMRMDDDSFIHSPINYDLFEYMDQHNHVYGYRVEAQDLPEVTAGFGESVLAYIKAENIQPQFLMDYYETCPTLDHLKNFIWSFLGKSHRLATDLSYNRWGYYNNFHITRLDFWLRRDVQNYLRYMDRIGAAYKYRWSDLPIQSTGVQIFAPKSQVHRFDDWTYEHASSHERRLFFGGIYQGTSDYDSQTVRDFEQHFGRRHCRQTK